jgi:DNA-binding PucR family transcriptional regulator
MLRDPAHAPLVDTLEAYLDRAGDAKATAEALSLHRATLYYRLNRIEEITGARLKTGEDRLALHLGLRLARLSGLR